MVEIKLGGKVRELKFTFKSLRSLETHYKKGVSKVFAENMADESLENLVIMLWACLRATDKKITPDRVEDLLDEALDSGEVTFNELSEKLQEAMESSTLLKSMQDDSEGDDAKN